MQDCAMTTFPPSWSKGDHIHPHNLRGYAEEIAQSHYVPDAFGG